MFVTLLSIAALLLPSTVSGSGFYFFACPSVPTSVIPSTALTTLAAMGPLKLVLQSGTSVDESRACSTIEFATGGLFTYSYRESTSAVVTPIGGTATYSSTTKKLTLNNLPENTLTSNSAKNAELTVALLDDSELVLTTCKGFFFVYDHTYVFSKSYASEIDATCAATVVQDMFSRSLLGVDSLCIVDS